MKCVFFSPQALLSVSLFAPAPRALAGKGSVPMTVQRGGRTRERENERGNEESSSSGGGEERERRPSNRPPPPPPSKKKKRRSREADGHRPAPRSEALAASFRLPARSELRREPHGEPMRGRSGARGSARRGRGSRRVGVEEKNQHHAIALSLLLSLSPVGGKRKRRSRKRGEDALLQSCSRGAWPWNLLLRRSGPRAHVEHGRESRTRARGAGHKEQPDASEKSRGASTDELKIVKKKKHLSLLPARLLHSPGSRGVLCWRRGLRAAGGGRCLLRNRYQRGSNQPGCGEGT